MHTSPMLLLAVYMPYMEEEYGEGVLISGCRYIRAVSGSRTQLKF